MTAPRVSEDSSFLESHSLADLAAIERSLQRRKVLEELISTEEGYIGDVRFLMNVIEESLNLVAVYLLTQSIGICHNLSGFALYLRWTTVIHQPELDRDCQITRATSRRTTQGSSILRIHANQRITYDYSICQSELSQCP